MSDGWRDEAINSLMDAGYISPDYPESAAAAVDLVVAIICQHAVSGTPTGGRLPYPPEGY